MYCIRLIEIDRATLFGCLFDYANFLPDAQYFISHSSICEGCASDILGAKETEMPAGHREYFLDELRKWLAATQRVNPVSETGTTREHHIALDPSKQ